ncbi:MAG: DNA-3-methyladenine glycosylase 2 family protein [Clostridia bacterium]|nr:DNA-3-methyladenine glycosylase 2 family protein [Clostridia bacterium]
MLVGNEALDLRLTLIDSAQCFRWAEWDGRFGCVLDGSPVWLHREADGIHAEGCADRDALRHYLDLDRDYGALAAEYGHIPAARRAIGLYPGLRVLNQPVWEALICFILSANNNVTRIRGLVAALSERYGAVYDGGLYGFPTPEVLANADEAALRALKVGYRARYLIDTARRVCDGFPLDDLRRMPCDEARTQLVSLPGVGEKVADCVLLFGCEQTAAFPVDVWVARLLADWFGLECASRSALARQARAMLGEHAGLMQQFLFHAARTGGLELGK